MNDSNHKNKTHENLNDIIRHHSVAAGKWSASTRPPNFINLYVQLVWLTQNLVGFCFQMNVGVVEHSVFSKQIKVKLTIHPFRQAGIYSREEIMICILLVTSLTTTHDLEANTSSIHTEHSTVHAYVHSGVINSKNACYFCNLRSFTTFCPFWIKGQLALDKIWKFWKLLLGPSHHITNFEIYSFLFRM